MKRAFLFLLAVGFAVTVSAQELVDKVQLSFEGVNSINVKGAFCCTEFATSGSSEVLLDGEIRGLKKDSAVKIRYSQTGTRLNIWVEYTSLRNEQLKGYLILTVPESAEVTVSNISGSVSVEGPLYGKAIVETVSGSIIVSNLKAPAELKSTSGNIKAKSVQGDVKANSVSGEINIEEVMGFGKLSTVSGSINASGIYKGTEAQTISGAIGLREVVGGGKVNSVSGNISINAGKGDFHVGSTSGTVSLTSHEGILDIETISGSIVGSSVKLTGTSSFKSKSGNIDMDLTNRQEELSFDLESTSGGITYYGIKGKKRIFSDNGNIKINGNTLSGEISFK
jgi:DUF4097 and DUF4098 domain-containing protein YvlB